jgi:benzoate membrane transport protein
MASIAAGVFYLLLGVLGATVGALFAAFPKELVASIAGLALFATIAAGLTSAMRDEQHREPALITFLITASGVTLFGVGSAFWGLLGGVVTLAVYSARGKT